jgi:hypothetical protein
MRVAIIALASCGSHADAPPPPPAPVTTPAAPTAAAPRFVRVDAELANDLWFQASSPADTVGHMELVGELLCKTEARFGRGDVQVPLSGGPPRLGFPLRYVPTNEIIVPMTDGLVGYAGEASVLFATFAVELDTFIEAAPTIDCDYTFPETLRLDHAGVRDGKPFFEHLGIADTMEYRLAQFVYNDEHGGKRKDEIEHSLCEAGIQNWAERGNLVGKGTKGDIAASARTRTFEAFAHKDELHARLVQCIEHELAELEADIAADRFDVDADPEILAALADAYRDIVGTGPLTNRLRTAKAALARGHRSP